MVNGNIHTDRVIFLVEDVSVSSEPNYPQALRDKNTPSGDAVKRDIGYASSELNTASVVQILQI